MNLKYLLDTNIISEAIRPIPNPNVIQSLITHQSSLAIGSVVWHEVLVGCYRMPESKRRQMIATYLETEIKAKLPILPYAQQAAEWFAQERARLTQMGCPPSYADGQIAAIAKVNDLILVTRNVSDYENFQNLKLENWFVD
jgi:tRNA(fMet)-specific endonuclease VapC